MSSRGHSHVGGIRWVFGLVTVCVTMTRAIAAAADACRPEPVGSAMVASVSDGRSLVLDDGREVRLAAIVVPDRADARQRARQAAAKAALAALVDRRPVMLRRLGEERDRYGRLTVQVFVDSEGGERWVQAELVARGHARVGPRVGARGCAAALLAREAAARAAKLGLWADPYYEIRRAGETEKVAAQRGRFAIVEGRVQSVRASGGTIYVNFSRRWSEDFTVTIARRHERIFAAAGLEPQTLAGRTIRVRGWVEERGGPWIEATRPEQIEVVEQPR